MPRRLLATALAALLLTAACGDDESVATGEPTSTTADSGPAPGADNTPEEDQAAVDGVTVAAGTEDGAAPSLGFETPFGVATTVRHVLTEGEGEPVADGLQVEFHFVMVNGRTGEELSSSYGATAPTITVNEQLLPGVRAALIGLTPGSEAVTAIAPADAFAGQGDTETVRADDTILIHVVVESVTKPLTRAEGTAVPPVAGLPTVALDDTGKPTITVPAGEPPTELVAQPLIEGAGEVVVAGQSITVHYTGVLWDGGTQFDSSWDSGSPATFDIGVGAVIDGWDQGLVGRAVGSQVLLVIPPGLGYGDAGQGSIPGGATLVFVVDILAAG